jgi:hypothetical protein
MNTNRKQTHLVCIYDLSHKAAKFDTIAFDNAALSKAARGTLVCTHVEGPATGRYTVVTLLLHCCSLLFTVVNCCHTVVTLLSHCCHNVWKSIRDYLCAYTCEYVCVFVCVNLHCLLVGYKPYSPNQTSDSTCAFS